MLRESTDAWRATDAVDGPMPQVPPTIGPVGHRDPPFGEMNIPLPHRTDRSGPSHHRGARATWPGRYREVHGDEGDHLASLRRDRVTGRHPRPFVGPWARHRPLQRREVQPAR